LIVYLLYVPFSLSLASFLASFSDFFLSVSLFDSGSCSVFLGDSGCLVVSVGVETLLVDFAPEESISSLISGEGFVPSLVVVVVVVVVPLDVAVVVGVDVTVDIVAVVVVVVVAVVEDGGGCPDDGVGGDTVGEEGVFTGSLLTSPSGVVLTGRFEDSGDLSVVLLDGGDVLPSSTPENITK
jgi:hypothetical protein